MAKPTIWALNYHEVLSDPRVFKQAKALAAREYDVLVFCDRPTGTLANEVRENVQINRFDCFSVAEFDRTSVDLVDRFSRSSAMSRTLLDPLVKLVERLVQLEPLAPSSKDLLSQSHFYKSYYKNSIGTERLRLKAQYLGAQALLKQRSLVRPRLSQDVRTWRETIAIKREIEKAFRDTHHASSFVFAHNLLKISVETPPQIVHAHDLFTLPAALELKRLYGCKVIYDAHEIETARATKIPALGRDYVDALEQDCLEHVDAMVTVSNTIGAFYAERFAGPAPTIVMNAPEVRLSPQDAKLQGKDVRSRAGLGEDVPLLVYTGGIQREHRGLDKVVAALASCADVHLVTMGDRHASNDAWLQDHAKRNGVLDRLHMLDSVPADEVVGTIASANAAIIPIQGVTLSYQMAMPNKLFEAAIARLPILVSDLPDMRRFVEELDIGIVMDHTTSDGIAQAISDFLSSKRGRWGNAAAEHRLETNYSWRAQEERLHALYRELEA